MKPNQSSSEYAGIRQIASLFGKIAHKFGHVANRLNLMLYRMDFGQRDDDIYLVTFPKSGTTMMQVILYQLCTDGKGNMDFHHIYDVSPWVSNDAFLKRPVRDLPSPRIIKSHEHCRDYEKGTKGRFIYVYRNGMDVAVSLFNQNRNYNNPNLTFEKSFEKFMTRNKHNWFNHLKDWFRNTHKFPILYIRFEDLLNDKQGQISRIIDFLKLDVSNRAVERAIEFSSFDYMKSHEDKFGVQPPDLSRKVFDQFIRKGKSGEGEEVSSPDQKSEYQVKLEKTLGHYKDSFSLD